MSWKWGLVAAALAVGCGNENNLQVRQEIDSFVQAPTDKVDILFVVDDSATMEDEQSALARGFDSFAREILATKVDFHIGVVSTSFVNDNNPPDGVLVGNPQTLTRETPDLVDEFRRRTALGTGGDDKEKGLQAAIEALGERKQLLHNLGFLRSEANLLVVIVSDEDDCTEYQRNEGLPARYCYPDLVREQLRDEGRRREANEVPDLLAVDRLVNRIVRTKTDRNQVQISAIVVNDESRECEGNGALGSRYIEAAAMTGGSVHDICERDWSDMLGDLGLTALGILDRFRLSQAAIPGTIEVYIDQLLIPQDGTNGWTYDADNWVVFFHGDAVPARGSLVSINYEVALFAEAPDTEPGEATGTVDY